MQLAWARRKIKKKFKKFRKTTRRAKYIKETKYWWHGSYRPDMCFKSCKRLLWSTFLKSRTKNYGRIKRFSKCYRCSKTFWGSSKEFRGRFNGKRFIQVFKKHVKWQISRKRWLDKTILRNFLRQTEGNLCKFRKRS